MAADVEPLLFHCQLGALRPVNGAAEDALKAIKPGSRVRIEIKQTRGNVKRLAWYWVMLRLAIENMPDAFDGPMTPKVMHVWLKRQAGLSTPIISKKTGEIIGYDDESISFHSMPENERAAFVDFAAAKLSARLGVDVDTLRREAGEQ
jgi:hypothetical protein